MENEKKDEMGVFNLNFPIVKNVSPKLLADDIKGMTTEETREAMKKMFDDFEKQICQLRVSGSVFSYYKF